ncbi:unnamed protein product [Schistocephalus solidus]|uniref:Uncharacterized protein n=1 Tax=Schistocephalus solidus TaxID=70667 RepID=A0A183TTP8_SCHSO|nr:unnamed protein product [Schistocephalus solidus]
MAIPVPLVFVGIGHLPLLDAVRLGSRVTVNRFLLWDVVKATPPPAAAPADTSTPSLLSASGAVPPPKKHSKAGPNLLLDLPLAAILHVRSVTSCDVLHAPPEDLPKIFQIIFDQCRLQQQQSDVLTGKTGLPLRSSSPGSKPHAVTPPPKSAPPTGLAGTVYVIDAVPCPPLSPVVLFS